MDGQVFNVASLFVGALSVPKHLAIWTLPVRGTINANRS